MLLSELNLTHMIGKDDNQEEVTFKVADRRKFNPDGSVKEGVTLDASPPPPKAEEKPAEHPSAAPVSNEAADETDDAHTDDAESDIPGADDPASFVNFLSTLATNAAA